MAFVYYNPNPHKNTVGDCVIRALCKALDSGWYKVYSELAIQGYAMADMPSSNNVWGQLLKNKGYCRYVIPNTCPDCYTVKDFCEDHPNGNYVLATGSHVICVDSGNYFDSWDSGDESPIFFWRKE